MSGPKRNPDKLNTIGVVVVGICGAVMVYVTIVALQAFYMNDTSELQTMADYGGQDTTAKSHKAAEMRNITEAASNGAAPGTPQTYRIRMDNLNNDGAMYLVVHDAQAAAAAHAPADHLVPLLPPAVKTTVKPIFSRGQPLDGPTPTTPTDGAGSGAGSAAQDLHRDGAGSGAAPAPATGSGAPPTDKKPAGTGSGAPPIDRKPPAAGSAAGAGGHAP